MGDESGIVSCPDVHTHRGGARRWGWAVGTRLNQEVHLDENGDQIT